MHKYHRNALAFFVTCGLLVFAGSYAAASINSAGAATGTIYGCLSPSGGLSRVGPNQPSCPSGYRLASWQGTISPLTSPTPTPTPTVTVTPTPTPTPTQTSTACILVSNSNCGPYAFSGITTSNGYNTYVRQNIWDPINISQTLTAYSPGDWSVSASSTGTAVQSYPDIQQLYTTTSDAADPLSSFSSIKGSFTDTGVSNAGDYEWAYDIWLGTGACDANCYTHEIMIWTDNHGQTPAGIDMGQVTIGGTGYELWTTSAPATTTGSTVTLVEDTQGASQSVDILTALNWLVSNGYAPAGAGLNDIEYGVEVCSTGGSPETFGVSAYGLTTS